jgi:hypothetical protein
MKMVQIADDHVDDFSATCYGAMSSRRIVIALQLVVEHDLFGKSVPPDRIVTRGRDFPDHGLDTIEKRSDDRP